MKRSKLVLLAVLSSGMVLGTGCGQNYQGSYTGTLSRVINGVTMSVQATFNVMNTNNNNSMSFTESDQSGSVTGTGSSTNSTTYNVTGTATTTSNSMMTGQYGYGTTGAYPYTSSYPGTYSGISPYTTGYPTTGAIGVGVGLCSSLTGTATFGGSGNGPKNVALSLTGQGCSLTGNLTKPN